MIITPSISPKTTSPGKIVTSPIRIAVCHAIIRKRPSEDMYEKVMDVNVKSIVLGTKYFVQKTDGQKDALIINFGSMASKRANPAAPHYSAAKAAVNMFSVGYAQQLKNKNIRFTCLNLGPVDTSFYEGRIAPEKRVNFMKPCDVAEVVEFIVSRDTCVVFHDIMFDSFAFFKQ